MPLFDAHCHLEQLTEPHLAVARAGSAGVERLLAMSEGLESCKAVLALKRQFPGVVLAGLGIHPMFSVSLSSEELEAGLDFIQEHLKEADALGEVGLDFKYARSPAQKAAQKDLLERLLAMAAEAGVPVNLHSRWAERPVMEIAIRHQRDTGNPVLLHWFTSSKKLIRICAEEGVYVSVGPSILFDGPASEVCLHIPDPLLLIETDSPVPFKGEPAEPAWAARVFERLAALRGSNPSCLEARLNENFDRYLRGAGR
jgi:TatD DNase family protein